MVEPKNYRIKSFVRERDFLANNFKSSYGYYLLDKPLYKEEIILHLSVDKEDNFVSINVNYANGTVFAPFYNPDDIGNAFAQGIFMEYGITEDDRVETSRNGGFGSTDKNK